MATGDPTGVDLASGTTNGNTLPQVGAWEEREITLGAGVELTSGTQYAIVVRAPDATPGDSVHWILLTSNGYATGNNLSSANSGSTWTAHATWDSWFITKAGVVEKDAHEPAGEGVYYPLSAAIWIAQSFTASSTYTITSVILKMQRFIGVSPGTITVSIKALAAVPSKATTPSPTNANTAVTLDQATVTWVDGGGADTFNVYYGTTSGSLSLVSSAQAGTSFTVTGITDGSPYNYIVTRYWRIDSTNDAGTTTGTEWSFTTIRFAPPGQTYDYNGTYYRLLVQADGSLGDVPGVGVENTDYVYLAAGYESNAIRTNRKLVAAAENRIWYEAI